MEIFDQKLIHKLVDLEFATVATAYFTFTTILSTLYLPLNFALKLSDMKLYIPDFRSLGLYSLYPARLLGCEESG